MKAVILAGGRGTRISEETYLKPKPMVEIGTKPILWHIMKHYSFYGINEFVICCGYKGYLIKEYFANYFLHMSDVTVRLRDNSMEVHNINAEPWEITLVDTGEETLTGGRLKRVRNYLQNSSFCFTYGDGLSNICLQDLIDYHTKSNKLATLTAVQPPGRFGLLSLGSNGEVKGFNEKPKGDDGWINGGFFVLEPTIFDFIEGDHTIWEREPLQQLASMSQLQAYQHSGFWQCMDTLQDKSLLTDLWLSGKAPWKVW